jgi:membrane fusion protein (multidrug efflux system)
VSDETTLSSAKTTRKRGLLLLGAAVVIAGLGWGGYTLFFAPPAKRPTTPMSRAISCR